MARFELVAEIRLHTALGPKGDGLLNNVRYFCRLGLSCRYRLKTKISRPTRISLREIRSLFGRIKSQLGGTSYVQIVPSGQSLPTRHPISCIQKRAHSEGRQWLQTNHPWATLVALEIFLEAWDRGEKLGRTLALAEGSYTEPTESNTQASGDYTPAKTTQNSNWPTIDLKGALTMVWGGTYNGSFRWARRALRVRPGAPRKNLEERCTP